MTALPKTLPDVIPDPALDPSISIWVKASAGSGKTTLLTRRVLRLMLEGMRQNPARLPNILCLTYTRSGAAEMQNRIHSQLAEWTALSDDALRDRLFAYFALQADSSLLKKARRLFALALDKPENLRIMTMHAFCQMVLRRFPLEAEISPQSRLLEGMEEVRLQERVLSAFFASLPQEPALLEAFQRLASSISSFRVRKGVQEILSALPKAQDFFETYPSLETYQEDLRKRLNLTRIESEEEFLHHCCFGTHIDETSLRRAASALHEESVTDREKKALLSAWLEAGEGRITLFEEYSGAFLTDKGEILKTLATKKSLEVWEGLLPVMQSEADRIHKALNQLKTLRFFHLQSAFFVLARQALLIAEKVKKTHASLTYNDLILKTLAVLSNPGVAQWILYKLDGGIDHLLVDEAQDTSPEQWQIIMALLEDFLSGETARENTPRTLFVVGDEKQSIFSFQGADLHNYLAVQNNLMQRMKAAKRPLRDVEKNKSFRSGSAILSFVDTVFAGEARAGVSSNPIQHQTNRSAKGLVEMWPPILSEKAELPPPWTPPLQREEVKPAPVQLAERIAATIRGWLDTGTMLKTREGGREITRALRADDIMILLQRRGTLLAPIVRALKDQRIPVAGVDRMVLTEQAAVQDVLALCRFLLLPQDDLTLAEILRGPFIRITDEALQRLAYGREEHLWARLQTSSDPHYQTITAYLRNLLALTDFVSPFTLLNRILFSSCVDDAQAGQRALIRRLGPDAVDPLEELLAAARRHEERKTPSLQLFLQEIAEDDSEIKRELSKASGEVRILTTHGAKGLEAPVVFVPDLIANIGKPPSPPFFLWDEGAPLFCAPKDSAATILDEARSAAKQRGEEENKRLLYVALTRAADVLILCGAGQKKDPPKKEPKEKSKSTTPWFDACDAAMRTLDAEALPQPGGEAVLRYGDSSTLSAPPQKSAHTTEKPLDIPALFFQKVPETPTKARIINPSSLAASAQEPVEAPKPAQPESIYQRGLLLHRLLQMLPDIPEASRETAARDFLMHQTGKDAAACETDVKEIMQVLKHPTLAPLFAANSQAEVPVVGVIAGKSFSGQIDRLVIEGNDVIIVDYKTNRPPPRRIEDVPPTYLAQLAAYRLLLQKIYKGKNIRTALLWTHVPFLMEITEDHLKPALNALQAPV
jgi:ATP-dependent helicase/nuclease subunit A